MCISKASSKKVCFFPLEVLPPLMDISDMQCYPFLPVSATWLNTKVVVPKNSEAILRKGLKDMSDVRPLFSLKCPYHPHLK